MMNSVILIILIVNKNFALVKNIFMHIVIILVSLKINQYNYTLLCTKLNYHLICFFNNFLVKLNSTCEENKECESNSFQNGKCNCGEKNVRIEIFLTIIFFNFLFHITTFLNYLYKKIFLQKSIIMTLVNTLNNFILGIPFVINKKPVIVKKIMSIIMVNVSENLFEINFFFYYTNKQNCNSNVYIFRHSQCNCVATRFSFVICKYKLYYFNYNGSIVCNNYNIDSSFMEKK